MRARPGLGEPGRRNPNLPPALSLSASSAGSAGSGFGSFGNGQD